MAAARTGWKGEEIGDRRFGLSGWGFGFGFSRLAYGKEDLTRHVVGGDKDGRR
jgi:hypothetical protein